MLIMNCNKIENLKFKWYKFFLEYYKFWFINKDLIKLVCFLIWKFYSESFLGEKKNLLENLFYVVFLGIIVICVIKDI